MNGMLIFVIGVISIIAGFFAFFDPLAATVTAEQLAAWLFVFVGFMEIFTCFKVSAHKSYFWSLFISALISLLIGFFLLFEPLKGILTLTIAIAVLFLFSGIAKIVYSYVFFKGEKYFWAHILSGLISIALAAMIFGGFPDSAASILGILLAVELIFSGASLVMVGLFFKKASQ